ncbi:hypothetical protein [Halobacterium zhouii]|uniref:hypothetical protein n=1 Tax=Halobacterium zhouii TaxID=2902624 RepID=UPI001E577CCC|nr:hypothetical protein [Halobacterium zhouii]
MADLTEYQEKVIETISTLDDVPMALLYHGPNGPEMFLQNDHRDRDDFTPHLGLVSAYVVQLARAEDTEPEEVLMDIETKINEWAEGEVGIDAEQRGGEDGVDNPGGFDDDTVENA